MCSLGLHKYVKVKQNFTNLDVIPGANCWLVQEQCGFEGFLIGFLHVISYGKAHNKP